MYLMQFIVPDKTLVTAMASLLSGKSPLLLYNTYCSHIQSMTFLFCHYQ